MRLQLNPLCTLLGWSLLTASLSALAWDKDGHQIIASIAWDHLSSCSQSRVAALLSAEQYRHPDYRVKTLVKAADWMDRVHSECDPHSNTYCFPPPKSWHYINTPYILSGNPWTPKVSAPNSVWALNNAITTLASAHSSAEAQAESLLIIDHLAGDISQPLHNISAYGSTRFKRGDRGGNEYVIHYNPQCGFAQTYAPDNLHAFWDQGAGLFSCHNGQRSFILSMSQAIELEYAHNSAFKSSVDQALTTYPTVAGWSAQAYGYAKAVYQIPYKGQPSPDYITWAQGVVKQQMMLSGLRLAQILNQAFIQNGQCQRQN